jgi:hypothetical protein
MSEFHVSVEVHPGCVESHTIEAHHTAEAIMKAAADYHVSVREVCVSAPSVVHDSHL